MKLNQLEARLPALYYSALMEGGPSYYFESAPGRGKTSLFKLFPKLMRKLDPKGKYGLVIINGANFTLMTALGFMVWETNDKGQTVAKFTLPYWWTTTEGRPIDEYDGVIILVDEADKLGQDEKKIVGEAALSKRLGNHGFPAGCGCHVRWQSDERQVWVHARAAPPDQSSHQDRDHRRCGKLG